MLFCKSKIYTLFNNLLLQTENNVLTKITKNYSSCPGNSNKCLRKTAASPRGHGVRLADTCEHLANTLFTASQNFVN